MNTLVHSSLAPRLDADDALPLAKVVEETPEFLADQRLAATLLEAIYSASVPRLLLCWPDGSLGFAWLAPGKQVADAVTTAYTAARASLESLHLQHTPMAATAWRN